MMTRGGAAISCALLSYPGLEEYMKITFINVGYGEAILIEMREIMPARKPYTVMIDGGGSEETEFAGHPQRIRAFEYLKKNGIKEIDLLISTHIHEDHTCGLLDIVRETRIGEFWCNYEIPSGFEGVLLDVPAGSSESVSKFIRAVNSYNKIYFELKKRGTAIRHIYGIQLGMKLKGGLSIDILGPSEDDYKLLQKRMNHMYSLPGNLAKNNLFREIDEWMNMVSIMLRFHYHGVRIFLPSDVNCKGYGHLAHAMDLVRADIFKAAHHGQIDGITEELAMFIRPKIVVTCASSDQRYNSSNSGTYEIIEKSAMDFGEEPVFLFTDNVRLKNYSDNIPPHHAAIIEIDDRTFKISCKYIYL